MPILIQWKWNEKYRTFLVIFHIYDDSSRRNIRTRRMRFEYRKGEPSHRIYSYFPEHGEEYDSDWQGFIATVHTWAPSHSEIALLMQVLSYANIINGLKENRKRQLRGILEMSDILGSTDLLHDQVAQALLRLRFAALNECVRSKKERVVLMGFEEKNKEMLRDSIFCVELCEEYIDYLKQVLKEYL